MKRFSWSVLVLTLLLSLLCALNVSAAEVASGTCGEALTWVLDDQGTLTVSGSGAMADYLSGAAPWSGKRNFYRQLIVPAGAFVRLEQAKENVISREQKLQAFASILSSCSTMIWDKPSYNAICDTVSDVAMQVPVFYLRNLPNEEAARMSAEACLNNA